MTEYVAVEGGQIAYEVAGEGPLVVMAHGMGDRRQAYRFLAPRLVEAGYRVAVTDMRGHGDSSMGWASITRTDVAGDIIALIRHLGGPAVIVGHSLSGGAATIAAAKEPELVSAIVELNPFTLVQKFNIGALFTVGRYRRGLLRLIGWGITGQVGLWLSYLNVAYPTKPADYETYIAELRAKLTEPGRMAEFKKTTKSTPADAQAQLANIHAPALVIMGSQDPDWPDPHAEGQAIINAMPEGLGTLAMVEGAGHYPHAQSPDQVAALIVPFLRQVQDQARA